MTTLYTTAESRAILETYVYSNLDFFQTKKIFILFNGLGELDRMVHA